MGTVVIEVEDNGTGVPEALPTEPGEDGHGIGLSNVSERLRVIYGDQCKVELKSAEHQGTLARVEIPDIDTSYLRAS